ncbi:MAG: rod shape-determining protein MreD [Actinobacteria bacterium]|nr:rod shape-determining protein MreD [Actinomycetota bacterium]
MILTWQIVARIALILVATVVLQLVLLSEISFLGGTPDVVPVIVVCLGLLGGAVIGAVCGFAAGALLDSALLQTLGVSSLVLVAVGYLAGRYRESFEISNPFVPPGLAAALTLFGAFAFAAIQLMLGVDAPVSLAVVREVILQSMLSFILAIPLYPAVRWALRPALVEGAPRRRRRLPVTLGTSSR